MMFAKARNGVQLVRASLTVFRKCPSLAIPLMVCWAVYAPVVVYLKFFFKWDDYAIGCHGAL